LSDNFNDENSPSDLKLIGQFSTEEAYVAMGDNLPVLILYGSETGNAQDVAELIARESMRRHCQPRLLPADAFMPYIADLPQQPLVIFVVSTTGQGDPPKNIVRLWKFLRRKSLGPDSLSGVATAVFGLGDSGYLKYNTMGKLLYRRLEALGANHLVPLGLGDDQHRSGYDAALDPWISRLWFAVRARFPVPPMLAAAEVSTASLASYAQEQGCLGVLM